MEVTNFSDHAANERTYLAWVRTSLSLMVFGFVVERFDLFVEAELDEFQPGMWSAAAEWVGLGLILAGIVVMAVSTWRYLEFKRLISNEQVVEFRSSIADFLLVGLVGAFGLFMFIYLARGVLT